MDVRVKVTKSGSVLPERQEVLTGINDASLDTLVGMLTRRYPDLASLFTKADQEEEFRVYVNNDPVPTRFRQEYHLRDGDTVSLLVK